MKWEVVKHEKGAKPIGIGCCILEEHFLIVEEIACAILSLHYDWLDVDGETYWILEAGESRTREQVGPPLELLYQVATAAASDAVQERILFHQQVIDNSTQKINKLNQISKVISS